MTVLRTRLDTSSSAFVENRRQMQALWDEVAGPAGVGAQRRRPALRRPAPPAGQDAGPRAHRGARRPVHAVPRAAVRWPAGAPRTRSAPARSSASASSRASSALISGSRHDLPGRVGQPDDGRQDRCAARRDRPGATGCRRSSLNESAGADLPRQADIFVPGGASFKNLTQLSKLGIPTITVGLRSRAPPAAPTCRA